MAGEVLGLPVGDLLPRVSDGQSWVHIFTTAEWFSTDRATRVGTKEECSTSWPVRQSGKGQEGGRGQGAGGHELTVRKRDMLANCSRAVLM